jgi:hypothetical protein
LIFASSPLCSLNAVWYWSSTIVRIKVKINFRDHAEHQELTPFDANDDEMLFAGVIDVSSDQALFVCANEELTANHGKPPYQIPYKHLVSPPNSSQLLTNQNHTFLQNRPATRLYKRLTSQSSSILEQDV